jgi:hypothetical protein
MSQLLVCHAKAAAHGTAVDPGCIAAVGQALARQFGRAETGGGCPGVDDATRVGTDLDRIVTTAANALRPSPAASACAARKLKALRRFARSVVRAFAAEAPRPADQLAVLDPIVTGLVGQLQTTFARFEARSACPTTADAAALAQIVTSGASPLVPDGILLVSLRLCPACGDDAQGGDEQCDGFDAPDCQGPCRTDCTCPVCGDGAKNQTSEVCDGTDDAACHGLCRPDCTCPAAVCGNGVKESGEACDGADVGACGSGCQADCTCLPAVCGNGIVEQGEQCDGAAACTFGPGFGCSTSCQCCDGGMCGIVGCCDPRDFCVSGPSGFGTCFPAACAADHPCPSGYTCMTNPSPPPSGDFCLGEVGSVCFAPLPGGTFATGCVPPAVCASTTCCFPTGTTCTSGAECCSLSCAGGTCS